MTYHNVYSYSAFKLWIAYSLSLALATLAVAIGLFSIYFNHASYNNSFSTILRIAKGAELSAVILDHDTDGACPLPDYIGKATVKFSDMRKGIDESGDIDNERDAKRPLVRSATVGDLVRGETSSDTPSAEQSRDMDRPSDLAQVVAAVVPA